MEETINEIMEYVRSKAARYSYLDQALIFEELTSKMEDLNADALRNEYTSDDYLIDGV
jgi:hypothetical protein